MGRFWNDRAWSAPSSSLLLVIAVTLVGFAIRNYVAPANLVMLYILPVVISGRWLGLGSAVLASVAGVLCFDFFFVPPYLSFAVSDAEYLVTFAALLVVALTVGTLLGSLRDRTDELRHREQETAALYAFSKSMVAAREHSEIAEAAISHARASLGGSVSIWLAQDGTRSSAILRKGDPLTADEGALAQWALDHARPAGWGEPEHAQATAGCIPLRTAGGAVGVILARHPSAERKLSTAKRRLLEAFAAQLVVVTERIRLAEEARQAQLLMEAERLHDAVLHSISHGLRTPLVSIIGNLSILLEPTRGELNTATRHELLQGAREEAERLNGLVGSLLDMARLETGHLHLMYDWHDLVELVGGALAQAQRSLKGRPVQMEMEDGLPLVPLDQVLMIQVIDNLLSNAAKYSPPGAPVTISARKVGDTVEIAVADRGIGIPQDEQEKVFQKFYRLERPGSPHGTGLGLAICRGLVEAHHGRVWVASRAGGGTVVTVALPVSATMGGTEEAEGLGSAPQSAGR